MARTTTRQPEFRMPRWLPPVLMVPGGVLAAVGAWQVAEIYRIDARGGDVEPAGPLIILFFAWILLHLGELFRRSDWNSFATSVLRGGTFAIRLRQVRLGIVLFWAIVPVVCWLILVGIPVIGVLTGTAFTSASDEFWMLSGLYGLLAACITGAFIGSLIKRAAFARAAARGRVAPASRREFWRVVSGQWFAGSFLLAIGVGCLGLVPVPVGIAAANGDAVDLVMVFVLALIGVVFSAGGVALSAASWRTGEPIGYAESFA